MIKLSNWRKIFLFVFAFSFFYLCISITNYTWINYNTYRGYSSLIENYLLKHKEELKNNLYEKTFSSAEKCLLADNSYDEKCLSDVRKALGQIIYEEELGFHTPSLFFALKENDKILRLGWDGKINNIKNKPKKEITAFDFILRRCQGFFGNEYGFTCEVYKSLKIAKNKTGYLGFRVISMDISFSEIFVLPFITALELIFYLTIEFPLEIFKNGFNASFDFYYAKMLFFESLPLIISILLSYLFLKTWLNSIKLPFRKSFINLKKKNDF